MSNASNLSNLANVLDDGTSGQFLKSTGSGGVAFDTVAAGAVVYATADLLPLSGNSAGDMAYVTATNRFYINNGSGWYSVSLVNTNPNITSVQDAGSNTTPFTLATDGTATVITVTAADPEEIPLTYGYSVTSGSLNGSTVAQGTGSNTNVFTVTPHASQDATFTITFTASDGINQATSANEFSLSFVTTVADSNHTTLLATATGTSDNNNITDSSSNSYSVTVTGDTYAGSFSPYRSGGYSTYFDGTGDYLRTPTINLTGNFTVEFFVNLNAITTDVGIFSFGTLNSTNSILELYNNTSGQFRLYSSSGGELGYSSAVEANKWYHVAITRNSNTFKAYLDGVEFADDTTARTINSVISIGGYVNTSYLMNGHIRDFRITTNVEYSSNNFTPPSEPLTAVSGTVLQTCHLPYIADGSTNDHSITINGDPETKPFSPYDYDEYAAADHGGSVYFDGSGDYIDTNSAINLSSGGCIEGWVYITSATNYAFFIASTQGNPGYPRWYVGHSNATDWRCSPGDSTDNNITSYDLITNQWNHFVLSNDGSRSRLFANGVLIFTKSVTPVNENLTFAFSKYGSSAQYLMTGNLSDVRVTTSIPTEYQTSSTTVGSSIFTPPTAPLSSSGAALHIKGTDASIIDKSQGANLELAGGTTGSTTTNFTGAKSIYIDGPNGDYISLPASDNYKLGTGDFTLETWVKVLLVSNDSGRRRLFNQVDTASSTTGQLELMVYPDGYIYVRSGSNIFATTTDFSDGSWYHLALVRHNGVLKVYVDGSLENSANNTTDFSPSSISPIIGRASSTASNSRFQGYIQDFRISKGKARYTANFTPPTAPLEG